MAAGAAAAEPGAIADQQASNDSHPDRKVSAISRKLMLHTWDVIAQTLEMMGLLALFSLKETGWQISLPFAFRAVHF